MAGDEGGLVGAKPQRYVGNFVRGTGYDADLAPESAHDSRIATARHQPALPPLILAGKQLTLKPYGGS